MFNMGEDMMKEWAQNWEKMMGSQLEKLVHNENFISQMAKTMSATMTGKAFYTKAVDQQLASMNLPSRTEVVKVMQKLTDVEERLIDLTEKFEDFVENFEAMKKAHPVSKPATKTEDKPEAKPKAVAPKATPSKAPADKKPVAKAKTAKSSKK